MPLYELDGDVIESSAKSLTFKPIAGAPVTLALTVRLGALPPHPRICRLTHDGEKVVRLEGFYLGRTP